MGRVGNKISEKFASVKKGLRTDPNLTRARKGIVRGGKTLPAATGRYLIQKVPVTQWLPRYMPKWIVNDIISGLTIGMVMVPQALAFAAIAGLPLQMGLLASWLPSALYFFQGTSKDLSTGPTSIVALATAQVIATFALGPPGAGGPPGAPVGAQSAGVPAGVFPPPGLTATGTGSAFMPASTGGISAAAAGPPPFGPPGAAGGAAPPFPPLPPFIIAATISIGVGFLSLGFGLLNLGWLLNLVSIPVLTGFIMGASLVIIQAQVPVLLGEIGVSDNFLEQGPDIINKIGTSQPMTIAIGVLSIFLLVVLQFMGKKWGKTSTIIQQFSNARNAIVIILFTGISFGVNNNLTTPLWAVTGSVPVGLRTLRAPILPLLPIITLLSLPVFIASALEHLAIGKHFGLINNYTIDASQELVFLGIANIANGILGGMPVSGGDLSRTSINSESKVKSPLAGLFTSALVLLSIYVLNGAVFWVPKATIAAVIIVSVVSSQPDMALLGRYWKTSFADFVAAFFAFQLTLVASGEMGIGIGIAFMIIYSVIRTIFSLARPLSRSDLEAQYASSSSSLNTKELQIPSGTQVLSLSSPLLFLNAARIKRDILDIVQTYHNGIPSFQRSDERVWSDLGAQRIASLRRRARLAVPNRLIPRLRILVLDFTSVTFIDTTGIDMLLSLKTEITKWGGEDVELRFVGLCESVRTRFARAGWELASAREAEKGYAEDRDVEYGDLLEAVEAPRLVRDGGLDFGFGNVLMSEEKSTGGRGSWDEEKGSENVNVIVTSVGVKGGKAYRT